MCKISVTLCVRRRETLAMNSRYPGFPVFFLVFLHTAFRCDTPSPKVLGHRCLPVGSGPASARFKASGKLFPRCAAQGSYLWLLSADRRKVWCPCLLLHQLAQTQFFFPRFPFCAQRWKGERASLSLTCHCLWTCSFSGRLGLRRSFDIWLLLSSLNPPKVRTSGLWGRWEKHLILGLLPTYCVTLSKALAWHSANVSC